MEENKYISLILKHFDRQLSPDEEAALQSWLEADPANRQEYQALERVWKSSGDVLTRKNFDTEAAWTRIDPNTQTAVRKTSPSQNKLRKMNRTWMAAAAVILVMVCGASLYYIRTGPGAPRLVKADHDNQEIRLPDGSLVLLRKGTVLQYPQKFGSGARVVELKGEAYFELAHDPGRAFRVRTPLSIIEDIGTSFFVKDLDARDEVLVTTGKIKLTDRNDSSKSIVIAPGEKVTLKENTPIREVQKINNENFMSWKTGILDFHETPLGQVVQDLHEHYQVPINISAGLQTESTVTRLTARFERQPLEQVLEEIRLTTGLSTVYDKDTLLFIRK